MRASVYTELLLHSYPERKECQKIFQRLIAWRSAMDQEVKLFLVRLKPLRIRGFKWSDCSLRGSRLCCFSQGKTRPRLLCCLEQRQISSARRIFGITNGFLRHGWFDTIYLGYIQLISDGFKDDERRQPLCFVHGLNRCQADDDASEKVGGSVHSRL